MCKRVCKRRTFFPDRPTNVPSYVNRTESKVDYILLPKTRHCMAEKRQVTPDMGSISQGRGAYRKRELTRYLSRQDRRNAVLIHQ